MRIIVLLSSFFSLLNVYSQKKQVSVESSISEIEFSNPYKFNSEIEERLKKDTVPWKRQTALLSYQKKGEYKKTLELFDLELNDKTLMPLTSIEIDSIKSKYIPV